MSSDLSAENIRFGPEGGRHLERTFSRDPEAFGEPTSRQEQWRLAALPRLRRFFAGPPADGDVAFSWSQDAPVTTVPMTDPHVGVVHTPFDRVSAIAMNRAEQAVLVSVRGDLAEPIALTAKGGGGLAYGHTIIDVAPQSSATILVDHVGSASYAANTELRIGDGAHVTYVTVQDWDADAVHVEAQTAQLGRDAKLRHISVSFGGDAVRITPLIRFAGPGGDVELIGLYFADAGQHLDARLMVDHTAPNCRSRVNYRGALQGDGARSVWNGDVIIRAEAEGTDTDEVNRNLLLTPGARADSVPNLEIYTGEVVRATHASATGRFDDEQLFYLMARGIRADDARRLVVRGFFADVIRLIDVPDVAQRLLAAVDRELTTTSL